MAAISAAPGVSEVHMPEQTAAAAPPPLFSRQQKCPYLAGRPPHGSHHMGPSAVNLCYARSSEEKPYGAVSKETQATRCFCGDEVYGRCPDFESARVRELELPIFDGKVSGQKRDAEEETPRRRERLKRRHRRSPVRRWLANRIPSTLMCVCWILLMVVAFWLVRRTM